MSVALITGSAGLIGSEAVKAFADLGLIPVGIDNNLRENFFGEQGSTLPFLNALKQQVPHYRHFDYDIRDFELVNQVFKAYQEDIKVIVHAAAQPSSEWAPNQPLTDFQVNATGTLNLLEASRAHCPEAPFIYLSTNKIYGDTPNRLPLEEKRTRWDIGESHPYYQVGIDEHMSLDQCKHGLFGVSKASADLLVQEYGRYFAMKTACFRVGSVTGASHMGTPHHGFLSYLMKCLVLDKPYTVYGHRGKQLRDVLHSHDLAQALVAFFQNPKSAAVYNLGGGPNNQCSLIEAIELCQTISGKTLSWSYHEEPRIGDQKWWVTDARKFKKDFPDWQCRYSLNSILQELFEVANAQTTTDQIICS